MSTSNYESGGQEFESLRARQVLSPNFDGPEFLGIDRTNAPDHARGKVLLDAFDRSGRGGLEEAGLELLAMSAVVHPVAGGCNPLAGGNCSGMANNGDQLTVATRLDPDDTIAVLRILVRDALNQPGKDLPIGSFRLRLHEVRRARGVSSPALYASQILLKDSLALVAMVVFC